MTGKRVLCFVVAALLAVAGWAAPAGAASLSPVADRYEPGDEATLVGYVAPRPDGWEADGPYMAFFKEVGPLSSSVRIGPVDVAEVDTPAGRALRVSLAFRVPPDAVPGYYEVTYCDRLCTGGLGDLAGSHPLNVGVDPAGPIVREWARNEPEIARLPAEAVVAGVGFRATAAELRAAAAVAAEPAAAVAPPTTVTFSSSSRRVVVPAPASTVPLQPPVAAATGDAEGNGWFVVLGIAGALAVTGAVLVAMREEPAGVPVRA